jgi:hypothetical protein
MTGVMLAGSTGIGLSEKRETRIWLAGLPSDENLTTKKRKGGAKI